MILGRSDLKMGNAADFSCLFEPFQLAGLTLPNRIVMAPMSRYFSPNGIPGGDVAEYYRARAKGGAGLLITEGSWVPHAGSGNDENAPRLYGDDALSAWGQVVDEVHSAGGRIMPQLWHVGLAVKPVVEALGLNEVNRLEERQVGPSGYSAAMNEPQTLLGRPMSQVEIDEVIEAYATAAGNCDAIGFDGIAIHGAHGYLVDQFLWQETNRRTDHYGGSHSRRARFAADVIRACKRAIRPEKPVILRISQWKVSDFGAKLAQTPAELEELLAPIVDAGVDAIDCSQRRFWEPEFQGSELNLAGWVKRITGIPTITVGSVGLDGDFFESFAGEVGPAANIGLLAAMLDRGDFDLAGVGRSLIADPEWPSKVRAGALDAIKPFFRGALEHL